ncbi:MAG: adenylate/guanylate cyclase domain-containing protein [Spirochaetes bacterium]|nr:adenylate/guanylate cyclase domain-containing protein [Spirochaetota bacterium]MBU0954634.1 adenylate/guanylate cyclase domain-containing protein [Spirochaetota bacterium]
MKKILLALSKLTKGTLGAIVSALVLAGLVALFSFSAAHNRLEYVFYDLRFRLKPKTEPIPELVLLNVDDASISALGVYPWPRHYYAHAVRQLQAVGLDTLVFDLQFMDSSLPLLNSDGYNYVQSLLASGQSIQPEELSYVYIDNDAELSSATANFSGTVLPYSFGKIVPVLSLGAEELLVRDQAIAVFEERASVPLPSGKETEFSKLQDADRVMVNYPIPSLMQAGQLFGYVDNDADLDGTHRRVRLVRVFDNRMYFHLGLVSFMRLCGVGLDDLEIVPGRHILIHDAVHPHTGVRGPIKIPVDAECAIFFDWMGDFEETARPVSAHALFEYPVYAEAFEMQLMLQDMSSGDYTRMELAEQLAVLKEQILAEPNYSRKFPLRQEYRRVLGEYQEVIQKYLDRTQVELADLQQRKAAGESIDDASIQEVQTLITAINIKTKVDYLFDSVAVMGLTATGTQDEGVTPFSSSYWMVGSYPTVINTLATGNFMKQPPLWAELTALFVLAILLAWFIHGRSAKISYISIALSLILVNAAIVLSFIFAWLWIDQVSLNLALILPAIVIMISKFAGEEENRRFIQGAFSKYLSQEVIEQIIANPDALKLGGQSCEITIFFSDVAGFSSISEQLTAEGLVQLLNEYLSEMTDNIMKNRGTVDKYEGDAIMAFWGAPLNYPEHPYYACLSAIEMQRRLKEMRAIWKDQGRHELKVRMGLNSGPAVAGNMGSHSRMNYTVMGDAVNLASRLEGANKFYGTYTMVSEFTYAAVRDRFRFRELDRIRVVGKNEPIRVYELIEEPGKLSDQQESVLRHYNTGIELFSQRRWAEARVSFIRALKVDQTDPPSKVYYKRCQGFIAKAPADNWDGVFNLSSK